MPAFVTSRTVRSFHVISTSRSGPIAGTTISHEPSSYRNIGGASRLDFTAIGPAVNLAARLEGLTGKLDRQVVLSSDLPEHASVPLVDLGEFDLKGVPGRPRAFGLV